MRNLVLGCTLLLMSTMLWSSFIVCKITVLANGHSWKGLSRSATVISASLFIAGGYFTLVGYNAL